MKRLLAVIFFCVFAISLFACDNKIPEVTEGDPVTTTEASVATAAPAQTTAAITELAIPNWQSYTIVYESDAGEAVADAISLLSDTVKKEMGVSLRLIDDFLLPHEAPPEGALEILIGKTNRAESIAASEGIRANDYVISYGDGKLVLLGGSDAATAEAVELYVGELIRDGEMLYPVNAITERSEYRVDKLTVGGVDISEFVIVRGAGMNSSERLLTSMLQEKIASICGIVVPCVTQSSDEVTYEILIGDTGRAETDKTVRDGCVNKVQTDTKLALYGNGDNSSAYLIKYLINEVLDAIPEGESYDIRIEDSYNKSYSDPSLAGTNLPMALKDYSRAYSSDFTSNKNVLARFQKSVAELPSEVTVLSPLELQDFPLSAENEIYVATDGNDGNSGTIDSPLATLTAAMRRLSTKNGGVIWVRGGLYEVESGVSISASATIVSPIFISAYKNETPIFTTGRRIPTEAFSSVDYSQDKVAQRIPDSAKENIVYADMSALGWTDGDMGSIGGVSTPKLYINGELCQLARYPNLGETELYFTNVVDTGSVSSTGSSNLYAGWIERVKSGEFDKKSGVTFYTDAAGNRNLDWGWSIALIDHAPAKWVNTGNIWYYGNVFEGWEFGHYNIEINPVTKIMTSKTGSVYGAKNSTNSPTGHNNYYLYNAIEALDSEGEWFYDPDTKRLYIYKTRGFDSSTLTYSASDAAVLTLNASSSVILDGITVNVSGGKGIYVSESDNVIIQRCTVSNTQDIGIHVGSGSQSCAVICNDVSGTGTTMITVNPGSASVYSLSCDRNVVQNNYLHDPRVKVQGGIVIGGHLSVVSHNYLENCQINFSTSAECIVEYNELSGGSKDVSDAGLIYLVGYYHHGNHIRYNYMHSWNAPGSGVYFDDLSSGNYAYYNIIDSTEGTRGKGINMLYTSSGHYNVFYGNILLGRPNDYIHESCLYFDSSSSLGYRFASHSSSFVSGFSSKYQKAAFYRRFPEYERFVAKMEQHIEERSSYGYTRNSLEIYLRAPSNNIIKNNVILGCDNPIYRPILNLTNSVTGSYMESTDLVESNYTYKGIGTVFPNYRKGDFSLSPSVLSEIRDVIPDFKELTTDNIGLTYKHN